MSCLHTSFHPPSAWAVHCPSHLKMYTAVHILFLQSRQNINKDGKAAAPLYSYQRRALDGNLPNDFDNLRYRIAPLRERVYDTQSFYCIAGELVISKH